MVDVSALVVTYDHAGEIAACLDSVLAQEGAGLEVVVVDNASRDDTLAVLAGYRGRVRTLRSRRNEGYAAAVNAAFAASSGGLVLLLNPDVVLAPGCLAGLVAHLEGNPRCGAAAALLSDPDGSLQRFARRDPGLRDVAWCFTEIGRRVDRRRGEPALRRRRYEEEFATGVVAPLEVDCPAAACVLVRRELMSPVPMDTRLPLFFNDADLWRRVRAAGYTVEIVPATAATHVGGTSIRRADEVRMRAEWVASARRFVTEGSRLRAAAYDSVLTADAIAAGLLGLAGDERSRRSALGTLGGLGLPGGPQPWLTTVPPRLERLRTALRALRRGARAR